MSKRPNGRAGNGRAESGFAPAEEPLDLDHNEPEDLDAVDEPLDDLEPDAASDRSSDEDSGGGDDPAAAAAPVEDWDFGRFIETNPAARGRVVDRNAYERQKRENAELKAQQAKFTERFDRMMEVVSKQPGGQPQEPPRQPQRSNKEIALDIVEQGPPEPELQFKDAEAYTRQMKDYGRAVAYLHRQQHQTSQQVDEQRQQDELHQRIDGALMESAQEVVETLPDWSAAANHYEATIKRVIGLQPGVKSLPAQRRGQAIDTEFRNIIRRVVAQAVQANESPAEIIYDMAKEVGYQPGSAPTPTPAPTPGGGAPKRDKGRQFKTLAKADGGPPPQGKSYQDLTMADMWNMSDEQWAQVEHEMLQAG